MVLGYGNPNADLMFVGEGPGPEENKKGYPFIGPSGKLLDKVLALFKVRREEVFVDNCVACWPNKQGEIGLVTRKPTKEEIESCKERLWDFIYTVDPLAIVSLGGTATTVLTGERAGITSLRGELLLTKIPGYNKYVRYPVFPTFHPSSILRSGAGEREDLNLPVRGPKSPLALFKRDIKFAVDYVRKIRSLYGGKR